MESWASTGACSRVMLHNNMHGVGPQSIPHVLLHQRQQDWALCPTWVCVCAVTSWGQPGWQVCVPCNMHTCTTLLTGFALPCSQAADKVSAQGSSHTRAATSVRHQVCKCKQSMSEADIQHAHQQLCTAARGNTTPCRAQSLAVTLCVVCCAPTGRQSCPAACAR